MGRQASRSSSLLATLGILWGASALITLIGGVYIHWLFVTLPATVVLIRTAAAMGRPTKGRRRGR